MPNHVHLLIRPYQEIYSISDILLSIKQSASRKALISLRKKNSALLKKLATGQRHTHYRFWQDGGGYDRNIVFRKTIINVINYIHNNPVRRGLVSRPDDWKWSSAKDWADYGTGPIPIEKSDLALI
jgi:putative transposase